MKLKIVLLATFIMLFACKKDDGVLQNDNPYLNDPIVNLNLNLNLPQFNPLKFPGNHVIVNQQGIRGIVIYNVNNELYTAFDLSDPNHTPSQCSRMTIEGIIASCPCPADENEYDIVTGQHKTNQNAYPMQQYRARRSGDNLEITN
jgi:hypothetical protein